MKKTLVLLLLYLVFGCASGIHKSTATREPSQYAPPYDEEGWIGDVKYFVRDLRERIRGFSEDEGVDINTARGEFGQTFLHEAAASDDPNTVGDLLRRGAVASARDEFDRIPLHIAVVYFKARRNRVERQHDSVISRQIIGMLIDQGQSDVNAIDRYGNAPLHYLARLNYMQYHYNHRPFHDSILLLIENGAEINITNSQNKTPLYYAAQEGNVHLVRFLIERYAADPHLGESVLNVARESMRKTSVGRDQAFSPREEIRDDHGTAESERQAKARGDRFNEDYPPYADYYDIMSIIRSHGIE